MAIKVETGFFGVPIKREPLNPGTVFETGRHEDRSARRITISSSDSIYVHGYTLMHGRPAAFEKYLNGKGVNDDKVVLSRGRFGISKKVRWAKK